MRSLLSAALLAVALPLHAEDPARQFDFWIGRWDVNLRTIQPDSSFKDTFRAEAEIHSILDGKAILELWDSERIKGFSLRYYDPAREEWVLWLNWPGKNRSGSSSLSGRFRHGRGEFFSQEGNTLQRYTFSDITPTSLRWDDAYSKDGGKSWTHQWIMEFSRTADAPEWPDGTTGHTWDDGTRCDLAEFRALDFLAGRFEGTVTVEGGDPVPAGARGFQVLDGCAVLTLMDFGAGTTSGAFSHWTYNTYAGIYELMLLDSDAGSPALMFYGAREGEAFELVHKPEDEDAPALKVRLVPDGEGGYTEELWEADGEGGWARVAGASFTRR